MWLPVTKMLMNLTSFILSPTKAAAAAAAAADAAHAAAADFATLTCVKRIHGPDSLTPAYFYGFNNQVERSAFIVLSEHIRDMLAAAAATASVGKQ